MSTMGARRPWWRVKPSAAVTALAAFIGLLVGLTTLFDWVVSKTSGPPAMQLVDARRVDHYETKGEFLARTGEPTTGLSDAQLNQVGLVFATDIVLRGHEGDTVVLQWRVLAREGPDPQGKRYKGTWGAVRASDDAVVRPAQCWVPYPEVAGIYVLRMVLLDPDGRVLDIDEVVFPVPEVLGG
jgi:hypothetical protein